MTKNSARKKAARKYQLENPGTSFPEAYRAVATPSTPAALPAGLTVVDEGEWVDLRPGTDGTSPLVKDLVSDEEWLELYRRLDQHSGEHDSPLLNASLDESRILQSERRWAAYVRDAARLVGMDEVADRLDPTQFATGRFEQMAADMHRHSRLRKPVVHSVADLPRT